MSISSRITQMEQHIGNAYDKIEDLGIDLTDVDKNINNISAMLENVWDEYPKVPATDVEEATLENTKKGRMNIDLKGNTEQEQLTGKNLLDISKVISSTNDNVINNGDGTLKVKGYGVSAGSPNNLKTYCPTLQVGDEAIISADTTSSNKFIYLSGTNTSWAFGTTRIITQSDLDSIVLWYGASGGDTNYYTISNIMVRKSSVTDSSYEPYCGGIPSPNPEYPQQIKNVTGNVNVKIQNKNLFDEENATIKLDFAKDDNGNEIGNISGNYTTTYTKVFPNTRYTFSYNLSSTVVRIYYYNEEKSWISRTSNIKSSSNDYTFTTPSNCCYLQFQNVINFGTAQLEQGTTATTYVPHAEQNYPFSLKSKNLVNISTLEKGYVSATGIITANDNMGERYSKFIKVKPNTNYIFSIIETSSIYDNWFGIGEYSSNDYSSFIKRDIMTIANQSYIQFTTSSTTEYIVVSARNLKDATKIQLEEGSTATDYEPYYDIKAMQGTTLQDDGIHNARTKFKLYRVNWQLRNVNTQTGIATYSGSLLNRKKNTNNLQILSTHFLILGKVDSYARMYDKGEGISYYYNTTLPTATSIYLNAKITILEELLTFLKDNNVEVEYELETEEIIPYQGVQQAQYNAIKQARSYDDQTNISQTNDELPFILDIETLKGKTTNEVNLLTSNNRKTAEYLESSLEPEEVEKLEEVEEPKEVEIPEEEVLVDTEENTESTAENAENSAESKEEQWMENTFKK